MSALARAQQPQHPHHPHHPHHPGVGSVEAFLAWEREQAERHEYVAGEIHATVGASLAHGRIVFNLAKLLDAAVEPGRCAVFIDGAKLRIGDAVFHPDVMVSCEGVDLEGDLLGAPVLIAEVLSPSTQRYDQGAKWAYYQRLPSLRCFLLVDQARVLVHVYQRSGAGWSYDSFVEREAVIEVEAPRVQLRLAEVYAGIDELAAGL